MGRTGRVQSIDRAVNILNCFTKERSELRLSEISDILDINKSTIHGIITTLRFHGLIDQDEDTKKYRLGLYLLVLGDITKNSLKISEIAKPYITEVCNLVEETVHLGTLDKIEVVYLDKTESDQSMRIVTTIGSRIPAHCTSIGKAMLAYIDKDILDEILPDKFDKYTEKTIFTKRSLLEELEFIRENGYSTDNEEYSLGLTCIAAPIFDHNKRAKYAISISGPTVRMTDKKRKDTIEVIKRTAKEISFKLGYRE